MAESKSFFSDEFKGLSVEERRQKIKAAGVADLSDLPPEVQNLVKASVLEHAEQVDFDYEPVVKDYRTGEQAV